MATSVGKRDLDGKKPSATCNLFCDRYSHAYAFYITSSMKFLFIILIFVCTLEFSTARTVGFRDDDNGGGNNDDNGGGNNDDINGCPSSSYTDCANNAYAQSGTAVECDLCVCENIHEISPLSGECSGPSNSQCYVTYSDGQYTCVVKSSSTGSTWTFVYIGIGIAVFLILCILSCCYGGNPKFKNWVHGCACCGKKQPSSSQPDKDTMQDNIESPLLKA